MRYIVLAWVVCGGTECQDHSWKAGILESPKYIYLPLGDRWGILRYEHKQQDGLLRNPHLTEAVGHRHGDQLGTPLPADSCEVWGCGPLGMPIFRIVLIVWLYGLPLQWNDNSHITAHTCITYTSTKINVNLIDLLTTHFVVNYYVDKQHSGVLCIDCV